MKLIIDYLTPPMNRFYFWISNVLNLSKTEANGFVILISILLLISIGNYGLKYFIPNQDLSAQDQLILDSLLAEINAYAYYDSTTRYKPKPKEKKEYNYKVRNTAKKTFNNTNTPARKTHFKSKSALARFDINTADTSQLKKIRGIGSVLSKRIIKYRDILGGFVSTRQFEEVYGLQDSVIAQLDTLAFIATGFNPRLIFVNRADEYELKKHPYINAKVARSITAYRFQHGDFTGMEDLKVLHTVDSLTLARIEPYIRF